MKKTCKYAMLTYKWEYARWMREILYESCKLAIENAALSKQMCKLVVLFHLSTFTCDTCDKRLVHFLWIPLIICIHDLACFQVCHVIDLLYQCLWHFVLGICDLGCSFLHLLLGPFFIVWSYSEHSMCMCI